MRDDQREEFEAFSEDVDALIARVRVSSWESKFATLMSETHALEKKHRFRVRLWNLVLAAASIVAVVGVAVTMSTSDNVADSVLPWVYALCAVAFTWGLGMPIGLIPTALALSRAELRRVSLLRERRTMESLARQRSKQWHDDDTIGVSLRQRQHAWYQDQSDLNWRDRERAESMGLDVHTYVANVLNHDPD